MLRTENHFVHNIAASPLRLLRKQNFANFITFKVFLSLTVTISPHLALQVLVCLFFFCWIFFSFIVVFRSAQEMLLVSVLRGGKKRSDKFSAGKFVLFQRWIIFGFYLLMDGILAKVGVNFWRKKNKNMRISATLFVVNFVIFLSSAGWYAINQLTQLTKTRVLNKCRTPHQLILTW